MLALVGGDRLDLGARRLALVELLLVALEGGHEVAHGLGPEDPREEDDHGDARAGPGGGWRYLHARLAELRRPDLGVAALVARDRPEGSAAPRILLDPGQRVVQRDRVALELQVFQALLEVHR